MKLPAPVVLEGELNWVIMDNRGTAGTTKDNLLDKIEFGGRNDNERKAHR